MFRNLTIYSLFFVIQSSVNLIKLILPCVRSELYAHQIAYGRDWFVYDRSLARILHAGPCWPGPLDTAAFCLLACAEAARPGAEYDWLPVSSHQLIQFPSLNT